MKSSSNAELLEFLIEENARLNRRLSAVGKANAKRHRQLRKDHRGLKTRNKSLIELATKNVMFEETIKVLQEDLNNVSMASLKLNEQIQQLKLEKLSLMKSKEDVKAPSESDDSWKRKREELLVTLVLVLGAALVFSQL